MAQKRTISFYHLSPYLSPRALRLTIYETTFHIISPLRLLILAEAVFYCFINKELTNLKIPEI